MKAKPKKTVKSAGLKIVGAQKKSEHVTMRMNPDLLNSIAAICEASGADRTSVVEQLLRFAVDEYGKERKR